MAFLEACSSQKYLTKYETKNNLVIISKSEFIQIKNGKEVKLPFVVLKIEQLPFPIAVYQHKDESFSALFLQCTHQGCELNPFSGMIVCPCHGAEFDTRGEVKQGPAEINLKTFNTSYDNENIYIQFV